MAHPHAHEFLPERGTARCRVCQMERDHLIHTLPEVDVAMGPISGYGAGNAFRIEIKDGTHRIALVYLSAEDMAFALSGRMVRGKLSNRYNPNK